MHVAFVDVLADPITKGPLRLEGHVDANGIVSDGWLVSATARYPVIGGIPRFIDHRLDNYARSFGYQWRRWPRVQFESDNIGKSMEGYSKNMWERITGQPEKEDILTGALVADIGCGPGRFIEVARARGARVIGLDFSLAVEVAASNLGADHSVCLCQADALHLPIRPGVLDGAYSIGVLHHTPDPQQGVREASRALRHGGWFALSVYGKGTYYDFGPVQLWRCLFKLLWPVFRYYPALWYTYGVVGLLRPIAHVLPPVGKVCKMFFPFVDLPDRNWSLLDTFDSVTPSYQSAHESYEIFTWLKTTGFVEVEPTNWSFSSYRGVKTVPSSRVLPCVVSQP